jgi:hypothetical protein
MADESVLIAGGVEVQSKCLSLGVLRDAEDRENDD